MIAPFGETVQRDDESCPWGKLLQLSEKAEDYIRPKKCLAKHSAVTQLHSAAAATLLLALTQARDQRVVTQESSQNKTSRFQNPIYKGLCNIYTVFLFPHSFFFCVHGMLAHQLAT